MDTLRLEQFILLKNLLYCLIQFNKISTALTNKLKMEEATNIKEKEQVKDHEPQVDQKTTHKSAQQKKPLFNYEKQPSK